MNRNISQRAMICYWWDLVANYAPEKYRPDRRLTQYQHRALLELFKLYKDKRLILEFLEICHCYWSSYVQSRYHYSGPKEPSPVWISKYPDKLLTFAMTYSVSFQKYVHTVNQV